MTCNTCDQPQPQPCAKQSAPTCSTLEVQELCELPLDTLDSVPDYFLVERTVLDQSTGKVKHTITRLPGNRILPNGNMDNVFTLDGNNPTIDPQPGQPLPVYIQNEGTTDTVYLAGAGHPAQFFVVGKVGDLLLCQNTGVINTLSGNTYTPTATYYLGNTPGTVTTDSSQTGQKLFTVFSSTKLGICL